MRLVIGGPTRESTPASFAIDLAHLYAASCRHFGADAVWLRYKIATYIHVGREEVLEAAIRELDASQVLWLDTDMSLPADAAVRLAAHGLPMVAANYLTRDGSRQWTARRGRTPIASPPDAQGLESVDAVGFGVVLMRTDLVLGLSRPWFTHGRTGSLGDIGEDLMFCRAVRAGGHPIYIDHDLSKEIGHVGQHTYRPDAAPAPAPVAVQRGSLAGAADLRRRDV